MFDPLAFEEVDVFEADTRGGPGVVKFLFDFLAVDVVVLFNAFTRDGLGVEEISGATKSGAHSLIKDDLNFLPDGESSGKMELSSDEEYAPLSSIVSLDERAEGVVIV